MLWHRLTLSKETFLIFSEGTTSGNNLGFVDSTAPTINVAVGACDFSITQSPGLLHSNAQKGTTGAVLWKVTPYVASWLADKGSFFWRESILTEDATLLELGCGTSGLVGLAMSPFVMRYILTDQAYVMKTLRQNILENRPRPSTERGASDRRIGSVLRPLVLDWETDSALNVRNFLEDDGGIALLIACDCVYNNFLIKPFVQMCREICFLRPPTQAPTAVLVAQQLRSDDVFAEWLELFSRFFHVWRVSDKYLPRDLHGGSGYLVHIALIKEEYARPGHD